MQSGVHIGVRETRRIVGDYQLTADDVLARASSTTSIARGSYPIDIHNPKGGTGTLLERLPPGEAYDIPLRCLMPRGRRAACSSPAAASRARTRRTPPTASCRS